MSRKRRSASVAPKPKKAEGVFSFVSDYFKTLPSAPPAAYSKLNGGATRIFPRPVTGVNAKFTVPLTRFLQIPWPEIVLSTQGWDNVDKPKFSLKNKIDVLGGTLSEQWEPKCVKTSFSRNFDVLDGDGKIETAVELQKKSGKKTFKLSATAKLPYLTSEFEIGSGKNIKASVAHPVTENITMGARFHGNPKGKGVGIGCAVKPVKDLLVFSELYFQKEGDTRKRALSAVFKKKMEKQQVSGEVKLNLLDKSFDAKLGFERNVGKDRKVNIAVDRKLKLDAEYKFKVTDEVSSKLCFSADFLEGKHKFGVEVDTNLSKI